MGENEANRRVTWAMGEWSSATHQIKRRKITFERVSRLSLGKLVVSFPRPSRFSLAENEKGTFSLRCCMALFSTL